jgi:hypothetical protein
MKNHFSSVVHSLGLAAILVGVAVAGAGAAQADISQGGVPIQVLPAEGLRVIRSDERGLLLELVVPDYTLSDDRISVPGADRLAEPGRPELPKFSALIGIPAEGTVAIQVVQDEVQPVRGQHYITPAPSPILSAGDLQPGAVQRLPDRTAYASRALYPAEVARVADTAWLRDQHLARLEVYPFQYRAGTQELVWHRRLLIEVKFAETTVSNHEGLAVVPGSDPFEAILQEKVLNYAVARQWRSRSTDQLPVDQPNRPSTAPAPRYKLVVNHDGVYRVTYEDLQAAGLDVATIDPRHLQMTNQALDVSIEVVGEADGHFDAGDYVLFYGQKLRGDLLASKWITESNYWMTYDNGWHPQFNAFMVERYTDDNVYWLSVGTAPGLRISTRTGKPSGTAVVPDYYTATFRSEQTGYWRAVTFTGEDPFFWERVKSITSVTTRTYPITLTAVATQNLSATVTGEVVAAVQNSAVFPDHRTRFFINGMTQPFEDMTWDGVTRHRFAGSVPLTALQEGLNNLVFVAIKQPALTSDEMLFDWFKIEYARQFQADAGVLTFQGDHTGAVQYDVKQLTSNDVVVFDVSNPWQPQQIISPGITTNGSVYTASFEVSQTVPLTYVVADRNAWQSPASLTRYAPAVDLHDASNGADYIIITHHDFITGAQTLADYRATQGLRSMVVDVDDVFNQFTDGLYHPIAIKAFLKYAYYHWASPAPTYVLLVGDGHWNFKGYVGDTFSQGAFGGSPIYMPPYLAYVDPWQGEVDSSSLLAAVAGDDILPDLAIGRIPVNSAAEMNIVVSKTLAYEQAAPQDWQRHLLFVADNTPDSAGDFVALSEQAINGSAPKTYAIDRIYENSFGCQNSTPCPTVNYAITSTLNQTGALLVNYVGHGANSRWSHEQILITTNVPAINNLDRLPVILSLTCLDGYWLHPLTTTQAALMETMLRAPNGGDVASFSPTGLGVASGHDVLQRGFYAAAFVDGVQRFGTATQAAKLELFTAGHDLDLVSTFTIFGDPALRLSTYRLEVSPLNDVRFGSPNTTVTYTVQVTNAGFLTHTGLIDIRGNTWPMTSAQTSLVMLPGQSRPLVVSTTIPPNSPVGAVDAMTVTFRSTDGVLQATARLVTVNGLYGAITSSHPEAHQADPGATVTYTIQITNIGVLTDTFDLSSSGNTWPVQLSTTSLTNLPPNGSAAFDVSVSTPANGLAGSREVSPIAISSRGSLGFLSTVAYLTTTINPVYGFALLPTALSQAGVSGQVVTYSVRLTNTGNVTNTFAAAVGGALWPASVLSTSGPLAPWSSVSVPIQVNIPPGLGKWVSDTATLTITLSLGGLGPKTVSLITLANPYQVVLPIVMKGN